MAVLFCFTLFFFFVANAIADVDLQPPMSEPPYGPVQRQYSSAFRPTVVIAVAVLTTLFSITFLFLLYAKHCRRVSATYSDRRPSYPVSGTRNSGIDRAVIDSLPIFRFGSLVGHKDGLECSVCLNQFEPTQFLRLLPKCKHAFHVECVDTWLDAHSTCPLCRYRVDPEDVLLYVDGHDRPKMLIAEDPAPDHRVKRVIGRHSSAGERGEAKNTASFRRSLDDLGRKKRSELITTVGCFEFDRGREDGLLLGDGTDRSRFEHRIVVSGGVQERWSDLQPLDLLYLRSEMIVRQGSRAGTGRREQRSNMEEDSGVNAAAGGRSVINERSVSEITGLSRLSGTGNRQSYGDRSRMVTRWLAWVASRSRPQESEDERVSVTI